MELLLLIATAYGAYLLLMLLGIVAAMVVQELIINPWRWLRNMWRKLC